jgi:hypothetical protein
LCSSSHLGGVPAVRVAVFGTGPRSVLSRRHDDPADALYVLAVTVQAESAPCIAKAADGTVFDLLEACKAD